MHGAPLFVSGIFFGELACPSKRRYYATLQGWLASGGAICRRFRMAPDWRSPVCVARSDRPGLARPERSIPPAGFGLRCFSGFGGVDFYNGIGTGVFCRARAYVTKRNCPTLKPGSAPPSRRKPSSRLLARAICDQVPAQAQIRLSRPWWKSVHSMNAICIKL